MFWLSSLPLKHIVFVIACLCLLLCPFSTAPPFCPPAYLPHSPAVGHFVISPAHLQSYLSAFCCLVYLLPFNPYTHLRLVSIIYVCGVQRQTTFSDYRGCYTSDIGSSHSSTSNYCFSLKLILGAGWLLDPNGGGAHSQLKGVKFWNLSQTFTQKQWFCIFFSNIFYFRVGMHEWI